LEKADMDLPLLNELLPFPAIVSIGAHITADFKAAASAVRPTTDFDGGTSIGRALRLRIESLLI
jgi:hypothetical protein